MRSKKEFLYVFASVLLSVILFINATSFNFQNNSSARQVSSETYTNTLTNIPIDAKYNDKTYFVSGLTSEVTVFLKGSNRVALASEMQPSTRKFRVVADLRKEKEGTIEVPLTIENLPSGLTAVATPQKITVKVGKKVKRDGMIVVPQVDQSQIDSKLQLDSVTVSNERVSVTTDQETLAKIDKVIALLPTSERITGNYSGSVPLQAIDRNGVVLPVVITPFDTTMKVTTKPVAPSSSTSSSSETSSSTKATSSKTN